MTPEDGYRVRFPSRPLQWDLTNTDRRPATDLDKKGEEHNGGHHEDEGKVLRLGEVDVDKEQNVGQEVDQTNQPA